MGRGRALLCPRGVRGRPPGGRADARPGARAAHLGRLSQSHRRRPVARFRIPVRQRRPRRREPDRERRTGRGAPQWRLDRLGPAPRRHHRAVPARRDGPGRHPGRGCHDADRRALPPAGRPRRVDRHDELRAAWRARAAARRGGAAGGAGGAGRDGAAAHAFGHGCAARARSAPRRAGVGRARLRHRAGGPARACLAGPVRRLAPRAVAVRRQRRRSRVRGARSRGRRGHGARAVAAARDAARPRAACRRDARRRHRPHRDHRQPHSRTRRARRHLQLVLSDRHHGGDVRPLERSGTAAALPERRRVGKCPRRRAPAGGDAAARRRRRLGAADAGIRLRAAARPAPALVPYQVTEDERSVTLRLYGVASDVNWMQYGGTDPLVRRMSYAQTAADELTITLELAPRVWGYRVRFDGRDLLLEIRRPPVLDAEHPLRGRVVVLDPGHPPLGATGPTGLREPVLTLAVALKAKTLLERAGAHVLLTRTDSLPVDLYPRTRFAEQHGADVLVSIHANAFPDGVNPFTNNGTSVYYFQPRSADLARALDRALIAESGLRDLGMGRGDYALARPTWMPAALTEAAFIMIPEQEALLASEEGQWKYARGVAAGIEAFLRERAR